MYNQGEKKQLNYEIPSILRHIPISEMLNRGRKMCILKQLEYSEN